MSKQDFPPLWPPGRHKVSLAEFRVAAVDRFPLDGRRQELYQKLEAWVGKLRALGVRATLWIDGSFVTEKPGPDDIDCVLWNPKVDCGMTPTLEAELTPLVDRVHLEVVYGLDFYLEGPANGDRFTRDAYWSGVFGFCHDRAVAKGFVEIAL